MTIDEQLRQIARRAEEHQRPITVEEIVARASGQDGTHFVEPSRPTTKSRHRRHWFLVAAAVTVVVAALGLWAVDAEDGADSVRTVTDPPTTSPSEIRSGLIAFAADAGAGPALTDPVELPRIESAPEPMDIYLMHAGEAPERLISSGAHDRCPAFSPDGERLAYLSVPGTPPGGSWPTTGPPLDATIVVLRLAGETVSGDPELEVPFPAAWGYGVKRSPGRACPQWSPDGSRLAYLAQTVESPGTTNDVAELRVVTLDGQQQVANAGKLADEGSPFAWSPSGDAIAYVRDDGVWAATLHGEAPSLVWQPNGTPKAAAWSARGELAVTVERADGGSEVQIVDVDAGTATLVDTIQAGGSVSWSTDGSRLAFVQDGQIVLSHRDDGSTVLLPPPVLDDREARFGGVAWSPDGERLLALTYAENFAEDLGAYVESRGMALLSLSPDGALIEVLTPWTWAFDWITMPDVSWQPTTNGG